MDNFDFDAQPELRRDRIYVSWNEQLDIRQYAERYLSDRNLHVDEAAREIVLKHIALCPVEGTLRKADVDYYLDVNAKPELVTAASPVKLRRKHP